VDGDSRITNPYGAEQVRSAGFSGNLPRTNVGLDIGAKAGTAIPAPGDGKVIESGWSTAGWGNTIVVRLPDGYTYRVSHMQAPSRYKVGDQVQRGLQLGAVGSSGNATGPHVDLELRDPSGKNIDPTPLLTRSMSMDEGNEDVSRRRDTENAPPPPSTLTRLRKQLDDIDKLITDFQNAPPQSAKAFAAAEQLPKLITSRTTLTAQIGAEENRVRDDAKPPGGTRSLDQQRADRLQGDEVEERLAEARRKRAAIADPNSLEGRQATLAVQQLEQLLENSRRDQSRQDARAPIDLQTAQMSLRRAQVELDKATDPLVREQLQVQVDTAKVNLQKAQQPETVNAPATQAKIVRRAADGTLTVEDNPLYDATARYRSVEAGGRVHTYDPTKPQGEQAVGTFDTMTPEERARAGEGAGLDLEAKRRAAQPTFTDPRAAYQYQTQLAQQQAQAKSEELKKLVGAGTLDWPAAKDQLTAWWQTTMEPALAGYRAQAERQQYVDQNAIDAAQRTEDQRVEGINRKREEGAYTAGQTERQAVASLIPNVRSQAFLDSMAQQANAWSSAGPRERPAAVQFDPASFRPDASQIPDLSAVASQAAARHLASISPAAAAQVGRPLPQLPASVDLNAILGAYQPPQAPVA